MVGISSVSGNSGFGLFGRARIGGRQSVAIATPVRPPSLNLSVSFRDLDSIQRLRSAIETLSPRQLTPVRRTAAAGVEAVYASVLSGVAVDFGTPMPTRLQSVEQVNTAATSYSAFVPTMVGTTESAPWNLGSSAAGVISGSYDGSNGSQQMTFRVNQGGTHGVNDLQLDVLDAAGNILETVDINQSDPINTIYTFTNGLQITLGSGALIQNDEFTVDLSLLDTSFDPTQPNWAGSTALPTIGGSYLGTNGTGNLTFKVTRGGVRGQSDLEIQVFSPTGTFIQKLDIRATDAVNKSYTLTNGLTLKLTAGTLVQDETFQLYVQALNPGATTPLQPQWILGSAKASFSGTYDGSLGRGTAIFVADTTGVHGVDTLRIKMYAPSGTFLQNIDIDKNDPASKAYAVSGGLTLTLGAGNLIKGESFSLNLSTTTTFQTDPLPAESTAIVTMGGVYNGAQGTGALKFRVAEGGIHGANSLSLEVYSPEDSLIDTFDILSTDPLNQSYTLSNGLSFQISNGSLKTGETFVVNVDHLTPSAVNPDNAFNDPGNGRPNFDTGFAVTAGSFTVNGVTIAVNADDSINSVLNRINSSTADVTAVFDVGTETLMLERNTPGFRNLITVGNDTSGFLAATKLSTAAATPFGHHPGSPIGDNPSLAGISSGSFRINGFNISLDVNTDSINDIVNRINSTPAGVTAGFDLQTDKLSVKVKTIRSLSLDSNGTDFFDAFTIVAGDYELSDQNGLPVSHVRVVSRDDFSVLRSRQGAAAGVPADLHRIIGGESW